ncbi:lipopolysaccharide biosynthesis protein [Sphingorhabdus arenilitoris]|uniref:Lipopolysaccharide biosynthesis protein n=1 Tax=Sphingorhabdus arenilitoris TaxID=1490041 RepID=A0ABV8RCG6_9SPHN
MDQSGQHDISPTGDFGSRVKSAVFWRSGTQILAQVISWGVTLAVVRILDPSDYGLYAMTSVVLTFLNFLNGYGFASALIQQEKLEPIRIRQAFGMLILVNAALALIQLTIVAPAAAAYYRESMVADMLRWQSLIYLSTPFLVLPEAMMSRKLEFKKPAIVNLSVAIFSAAVALGLALAGWGVWTLVFAPIAGFWARAIVLMIVTRFWVIPSFNFKGAWSVFSFGGLMLLSQGFFIVQSQSDIFIAGRFFDNHQMGIYAQALFLTQLFATKFVPPLNEVAFPAYARLQNDRSALSYSFIKAVRLIMLITCPLYIGMAATAHPFVDTLLGPKWTEAAPLIMVMALAMPIMTLQILFHPILNAIGLPHISIRTPIAGAIIMPVIWIFAVPYGAMGLSVGWLIALPLLLTFTIYNARGHVGFELRELAKAVMPGLGAAIIMGLAVTLFDRVVIGNFAGHIWPPLHLAILSAVGAGVYIGLCWFFSRETCLEVLRVLRRRAPEPITPGAAQTDSA